MLLDYPESLNRPSFAAFEEILELGRKMDVPIIDSQTGFMLEMISCLTKPKKVLEIGTGISFSTHFILSGSPETKVITVDSNKKRIQIARKLIEESGFKDRTAVVHSDIFSFLDTNNEMFDMVLLDSSKNDYPVLAELIIECLKPGGIFIADNILLKNKVSEYADNQKSPSPRPERPFIKKLFEFNKFMSDSPKFNSRFFSIGDGLMLAVKL